jgi:pimeloyl-ACP methyl ester carboxylesterase
MKEAKQHLRVRSVATRVSPHAITRLRSALRRRSGRHELDSATNQCRPESAFAESMSHQLIRNHRSSVHRLTTGVLEIAYETGGPADGPAVLLLHGWPDDVRGFRAITPLLEAAGYRWVAPWLRGFGPTRFLSADTIRDGSGVALAKDAIDVADALGLAMFSVVGHDWGARTAYTIASLWPARLRSIVTLALAYSPGGRFPTPSFEQSQRWWYQWFMATDRGASAVRAKPVEFALQQWKTWSPVGWFTRSEFEATAKSFTNSDWTAITLHGYRSRWKAERNDERYSELRSRLAGVECLCTPTLMIQGGADACDPPSESEEQSQYFAGPYTRLLLEGVGHFPAREAPHEVADNILTHLKAFN